MGLLMKAIIKVDKSRIPASVSIFSEITSVEISKEEIFKFGIFKEEVSPGHVEESDLEYLFSKIPAYELLFADFLDVNGSQIVNKSIDDRKMKDISEIVGIALGLKLTVSTLNINQNQIEKIPPPTNKEKYLDYQFVHNSKMYEIETKGTTQKQINSFVRDIEKKKADKKPVFFRYGTVAQINKPKDNTATVLHLCDDPPLEVSSRENPSRVCRHYLSPLSFILDNKYYNQLFKYHFGDRKRPIRFAEKLFFGRYVFNGEEYLGDYFDRRLIHEVLLPVVKRSKSLGALYQNITKKQGKYKIFIGIHSKVLKLLFDKRNYNEISKVQFETLFDGAVFRDSDGVLIAKSIGESLPQIEKIFTEDEVRKRLGYYRNYILRTPVACGAPCRSRDIEGKPCEIKTFRGLCHYHR